MNAYKVNQEIKAIAAVTENKGHGENIVEKELKLKITSIDDGGVWAKDYRGRRFLLRDGVFILRALLSEVQAPIKKYHELTIAYFLQHGHVIQANKKLWEALEGLDSIAEQNKLIEQNIVQL